MKRIVFDFIFMFVGIGGIVLIAFGHNWGLLLFALWMGYVTKQHD